MLQVNNSDAFIIENLLDRYSLEALLIEISNACSTRAEYLEYNWQDGASAKDWDKASLQLHKWSGNKFITAVS